MARILVVDDEVGIRELLSEILYDEGHTVELAENAAQARAARLRARPDLVLLDIWMPDTDGVSLLKEWGSQGLLDMPVIMMSGHATIDTAVEATRIGALDFLEKPITLQRLLKTISAALQRGRAPQPVPAAVSMSAAPLEDELDAPALPAATQDAPAPVNGLLGSISLDQPLREARDAFERIYFEYHLVRESHSMTRVSEKTGLERTHLYRKLKQLGIESARKRST
ncbi:response regulator [Bordetella genomosp. 9]|uniref:Two-component system response regulator n=1 Tax=Bordetella genomosp. 9 TaxID=1416803 RepID=A0A1W6Z4B5_9BORD|nr:response regulator [Bordetella genomosp. 9]ARP88178.1 two-component system response regulator [Bordetella genomosp. 9]ARP92141.1 two-component system response regulator [Bordetella genomosp. 9]